MTIFEGRFPAGKAMNDETQQLTTTRKIEEEKLRNKVCSMYDDDE